MSLRARLALVFFLLAVLPLTGLTLVSYQASEKAFRGAVHGEAKALASDMSRRLDGVTGELRRRLASVGRLPLAQSSLGRPGRFVPAAALGRSPEGGDIDPVVADFVGACEEQIGDAAQLVEELEFLPAPPSAPEAPAPPHAIEALVIRPASSGAAAEISSTRWQVETAALSRQRQEWIGELEKGLAEARKATLDALREEGVDPKALEALQAAGPAEAAAHLAQLADSAPVRKILLLASHAAKQGAEQAQQAARHARQEARLEQARAARQHAEVRSSRLEAQAEGHPFALEVRKRLRLLPDDFMIDVVRGGETVGRVRPRIRSQVVLQQVLARTQAGKGEIPFALDDQGELYSATDKRGLLEEIGVHHAGSGGEVARDWVVVTQKDPETGLSLGIARPVGESLHAMRRAAMRNLGLGLGLALLATIGVVPLSRRLTRDLDDLTRGAEKLAAGDLTARVPVRSKDEMGTLAATFNRMAEDLCAHQEQRLSEVRLHKELEMGRRIQEDMLPRQSLCATFAEVKGVSIPAREVGGDLFNYFMVDDTRAALMVGDVSGKGVGAALLMANLQAQLRASVPLEDDLAVLADRLDRDLENRTPLAAYLTLFLGVVDGAQGVLRYVNAGHNPPFLLKADGQAIELDPTGRPLGLIAGGGYTAQSVALGPGDSLFLYTDGIVESEDGDGEPFGMDRLRTLLLAERSQGIEGILAGVEAAVRAHRGGRDADDDATMVVLRFAGQGAGLAAPAQV